MPAVGEVDLLGLPDVKAVSLPQQKVFDGKPFPLILNPALVEGESRDSAGWQRWVAANRETLRKLLVEYGALFFRGFSLDAPADFDLFTKAFGWPEFPYLGGVSVRRPATGNVYTSTESPPECKIPFHHEMAHFSDFPKILCAYCEVAAPEGGETPLLLSHVVYRMMAERQPKFVERLAREGVRYTRVAPDGDDFGSALGRSWQSTFFAEDRPTAEQNAKKAGFDVEWMPDGSMKYTSQPLQAIRVEPRTGKTTWFNSVNNCYFAWEDARNCRKRAALFPNGDEMPEDAMEDLKQVMEEVSVACRWQHGDAAIVDNLLAQHARNYFKPPRRVLISLFK